MCKAQGADGYDAEMLRLPRLAPLPSLFLSSTSKMRRNLAQDWAV